MKRQKAAYAFAGRLCHCAGEGEEFLNSFWERLLQDKEVYEEFCLYMEKQEFSCKAKVKGYGLLDVMVWQIDHFKARMDRGEGIKDNSHKLLLYAFDVFLKMRKEPESYIKAIQGETGTDYEGKY